MKKVWVNFDLSSPKLQRANEHARALVTARKAANDEATHRVYVRMVEDALSEADGDIELTTYLICSLATFAAMGWTLAAGLDGKSFDEIFQRVAQMYERDPYRW